MNLLMTRCTAKGPHHGDECNHGRVQCANAQFHMDCPACDGSGVARMTDGGDGIERAATISNCGLYRYRLTRRWPKPGTISSDRFDLVFIGLNPSTADAQKDDPTIRRCIDFARRRGHDGMIMLNLFAFRATDPQELLSAADPIGPLNDDTLGREVGGRTVVAAWGALHKRLRSRADDVRRALASLDDVRLMSLGTTKEGFPRHPLYVPARTEPTPFK